MTPAQTLVEIDSDIKPKFASSSGKSVSGTTYGVNLKRSHSYEDVKPVIETKFSRQVSMLKNAEVAGVDVPECSKAGSPGECSDPLDPDATEYSSSFSGTISDSEHCSGLSDGEVESQFYVDNSLPPLYGVYDGMLGMRKKKLTNHWREFIRPLMWRCKWTELRIREMESQALYYERELASLEQESNAELNQCNRKIMRRKKRKRVEEIVDVSSYMSQHNLFSYFENKRSDREANFIANEVAQSDKAGADGNAFGPIADRSVSLESRQIDLNLEQVLQKIEIVYSRVHKLRNQLDLIMSQNALRFSSSENLSLLLAPFEEAQTSSAPSPTFSAGNGDLRLFEPDQHPNYDLDNLDVGSSFGEVVSIPDVIESTVGLLSAANVTLHLPIPGDTTEDIVDNELIHNEEAEEGETNADVVKNLVSELMAQQHESDKGEQDESPDPSPPDLIPQQQSSIPSGLASDVHVPMSKRKRGERKSGTGGWNK